MDKINLIELLTKFKVKIPMIQRDYAQGRKKHTNIRNNFLNAIYVFLSDTKKEEMNLDFIYGYEEKGSFLPIDGQQRITTLWLLHVFFKSQVENNDKYDMLKKFSYATQRNATDFCKKLYSFKFTERMPSIALKNDNSMNPCIKTFDPTVLSMVVMLDAIYEKFKDVDFDDYLERLNKISFSMINMGEYSLGEELYIKMNARGKALSSFENFKAWCQQDEDIERDMDLLANIDNRWVNEFWKQNKESWDSDLIKFISHATVFFFLSSTKQEEMHPSDFVENHLPSEFHLFNENLFIYKDGTRILVHENLKKIDKAIEFIFKLDKMGVKIVEKDENRSTLIPKIFALLLYSSKCDDMENFLDWQAVTNHIIDNTRSRKDSEHIVSMFNLLKLLSEGCNDIYSYLANSPQNLPDKKPERVAEEIVKATLIISDGRNGDWELAINEAQNHDYFNGWIDFLLAYAKHEETYSLDLFKQYSQIACCIFTVENLESNLKLLQRALLSISDYAEWNTNWFLGESGSNLQNGKEFWSKIFKKEESALKTLFDSFIEADYSISSSPDDIKTALTYIIKKNIKNREIKEINNWYRFLMVKYPEVLNVCNQNRFSYDENEDYTPIIYILERKKKYTQGYNLLCLGFREYLKGKKITVTDYDKYIESTPHFKANNISIKVEEYENIITIRKKQFTLDDYSEHTILDYYAEMFDYIEGISTK